MPIASFNVPSAQNPFNIIATFPTKMTVGAIATYPFFFNTYSRTWPCQTRQPFTALDGAPVLLEKSCNTRAAAVPNGAHVSF